MRDEHVIDIIEAGPLGGLGGDELERVRAHAARCESCARAFEAARVSAVLLRERAEAARALEPSPFFQTRVLAALRERRAVEDASVWQRLWRATGALVYSMAAAVAVLAALTFVAPEQAEVAGAADSYSAEEVLIERAELSDEEPAFDEVFSAVYADEGAEVDDGQDR